MVASSNHTSLGELVLLKADWNDLADALRSVLRDTDIASKTTEDYLGGRVARDSVQPTLDTAWNTSKELREVLRSLADSLHDLDVFHKATVQLVRAAREMVQADNDTLAGRDGCEKRWDAAMKALKSATQNFRE